MNKERIIQAACKAAGINREEYGSDRRPAEVTFARHLVGYVTFDLFDRPYKRLKLREYGLTYHQAYHGKRLIGGLIDVQDPVTTPIIRQFLKDAGLSATGRIKDSVAIIESGCVAAILQDGKVQLWKNGILWRQMMQEGMTVNDLTEIVKTLNEEDAK
jgi:hypothetical protein